MSTPTRVWTGGWPGGADAQVEGADCNVYLVADDRLRVVGPDGHEVFQHPLDTEGWRWTTAPTTSFGLAMSRTGDLAVYEGFQEIVVYATDSGGLAPSAWPTRGGGGRNDFAR